MPTEGGEVLDPGWPWSWWIGRVTRRGLDEGGRSNVWIEHPYLWRD